MNSVSKSTRVTIQNGRAVLILCCLLAGMLLTACSTDVKEKPSASHTYEIAPVFREFHASLGGEQVIGQGISQIFDFNDYQCQYTVNVLMCQDPLLSGEARFMLYPLGSVFEIPGTNAAAAGETDGVVVNGVGIYEEFMPVYEQFSGERYAGSPINQAIINYSQQRVEQYFENIGMYRSFNDPPGMVKLLAYGAFACDQVCSYAPLAEAIIIDPARAAADQPFLPALGEMDSSSIFGIPLTQPYIAKDGSLEQVYTNAILFSPADNPEKISLRALPELLGIPREQPVPQLHDSGENVVFYPVNGELGFHVPAVFDAFIVAHGGRKFSGDPISGTSEISPGLYRQCFTYYCLLYNPTAAKEEQVILAPLGQQYLDSLEAAANGLNPVVISGETVRLEVTEQYPMLSRGDLQRIEILVTQTGDESPLAGIEATLEMHLPDGDPYTGLFPPTSKEGRASLEIPYPESVPNGSILVYEVCLKSASSLPVCAQGSYLVWKTP